MDKSKKRRVVVERGIFSITHDKKEDRYYFEMEESRGLTFAELTEIRTLAWEAHLAENRSTKEWK